MINSKLDASIIKLKHLQARYKIATGSSSGEEDSEEELSDDEKKFDKVTGDISIEYVLQMSQAARSHS